MNLGKETKPPETAGVPLASPTDSKEPKISYPDFTVRDDAAKELLKEWPCELGQEYAATVLVRVSALRADEYGQSVSFEVKELEDMTEESEEKQAEDKPDDEEKMLGYRRKKTEKEAPAMSAKDLVED
jgi:hypothetical protein